MKKACLWLLVCAGMAWGASAGIKVSNVEVFSGYPWKEVVVGYTIAGSDGSANDIQLAATDKTANKTYKAKVVSGVNLSDGRHVLRWNAAAEGVKFSSTNVVFVVSVVEIGVQLWANGPWWAECNAHPPCQFECYYLE